MTKSRANKGLSKVLWTFVVTALVLVALAAVLWWYEGYFIKEGSSSDLAHNGLFPGHPEGER